MTTEQAPENPTVPPEIPREELRLDPWITFAYSFVIFLVFAIVQGLAGVGSIVLQLLDKYPDGMDFKMDAGSIVINGEYLDAEKLLMSGTTISHIAILSGILCTLFVFLMVRTKRGINVYHYLGFKPIPTKQLLLWSGITVAYMGLSEVLTYSVPEFYTDFMIETYKSADNLFLLYLGVGLCAPFFEEVFFRGFMFSGWEKSKLGGWGTVLLTAFIFTIIHAQYSWMILLVLFPVGVILGAARLKSGSIWLPILLHVLNNTASIFFTGLME